METPRKFHDAQVFCSVRSGRQIIRVSFGTYNGHEGVDIRFFAVNGDGKLAPTKHGLLVPTKLFSAVLDGCENAEDHLIAEKIIASP